MSLRPLSFSRAPSGKSQVMRWFYCTLSDEADIRDGRENLDPTGRRNDVEMWEALGKCHLRDAVAGLDLKVSESGENLSLGQCQLLCLARALLRRARVRALYAFCIRMLVRWTNRSPRCNRSFA